MTNRKKTLPRGWIRCDNCFGTGYVVSREDAQIEKGILGTITNDKCTLCKEGYVKLR